VPQAQRRRDGSGWHLPDGFADRLALASGQCHTQRACARLRGNGGHAASQVRYGAVFLADGFQRVGYGGGQFRVASGDA
jgi:hypothetical protein